MRQTASAVEPGAAVAQAQALFDLDGRHESIRYRGTRFGWPLAAAARCSNIASRRGFGALDDVLRRFLASASAATLAAIVQANALQCAPCETKTKQGAA